MSQQQRRLTAAIAVAFVIASTSSSALFGAPEFEVWMADQSDTRPGFGGQLLVYDGDDLRGRRASAAEPIARIDLGAATADLCRAATGRNPVRPHMILFNREHSHAVISFVASAHVVVFEGASRTPVACLETTVGSTNSRQAHAAYPSPDGSFILVANQNGKRLERIDANFATNTFTHNPAATLDLATCTTPSGQACEDAELRPINWPICSAVDSSSRLGFITLRGGGLFVVDARATPMTILAAYDQATVKGNGCGAIEVGGHMYVNSGGSPVNVSGTDPHHPALYGFDVYRFPLHGYSALALPNTPAPTLLLSKSGMADSHGIASVWFGRHLLRDESSTRRVVASCCASPMFLDFKKGHWLSVYRNWSAGGCASRGDARPHEVQARGHRSSERRAQLAPGYSLKFMAKLFGASDRDAASSVSPERRSLTRPSAWNTNSVAVGKGGNGNLPVYNSNYP